jgi:hypothetical protein
MRNRPAGPVAHAFRSFTISYTYENICHLSTLRQAVHAQSNVPMGALFGLAISHLPQKLPPNHTTASRESAGPALRSSSRVVCLDGRSTTIMPIMCGLPLAAAI